MKDETLYRPPPDSFDERGAPLPAPPLQPRSWGVAFRAAFYLATTGVILVGIVPRFNDVYRQVKVPMPVVTEFIMGLGDLASTYRWAVYAAILLAPAFLTGLNKQAASRANLVILILYVVTLVGALLALFMPLLSVHAGIGPKKS